MARLARASALQFSVQAIQSVLGFLVTLALAQLLGATTLGQYFLALAVVNWLVLPSAGVRAATVKRVSEGRDRERFFTAGLAIQLGVVIVLGGAVLLASDFVNGYTGFEAALLVAGLLGLKAMGTFLIDSIRGEERVELAGLLEGGWHILRPILQLGLVLVGAGLVGLMVGEILAVLTASLVSAAMLSLKLQRFSRRHLVQLYEYGKYAWLSSVKALSYAWMDTIVLGFFVTPTTIGVYEIAWRLSALFIILPTAMTKVVFPDMSRHAASGNLDRVEETLKRALTFGGLLAIPGVVGAIVLGGDVLLLYGAEFAGGVLFLIILSAARIGQTYETLLMQTLNALDRPDTTFRISALFIVLNVSLNVVLVWSFGATGAAVATAAAILVTTAMSYGVLARELRIRLERRTVATQVLSALAMGGVIALVRLTWAPDGAVETVAQVALGAVVYFVGIFLGSRRARTQLYGMVQTLPRP